MEDNVVTRTSLPLSVAQSTLPSRITKSDLPTSPLQSLPHLLSPVVGRVC